MRLVVAMTGATGAPLGIRLLEVLGELGVETHLILSDWARATIKLETDTPSTRSARWLRTHTVRAILPPAFPADRSAPMAWWCAHAA